jgi:hypothetical protein
MMEQESKGALPGAFVDANYGSAAWSNFVMLHHRSSSFLNFKKSLRTPGLPSCGICLGKE